MTSRSGLLGLSDAAEHRVGDEQHNAHDKQGDMPPGGARHLFAHERESARTARCNRSERSPSACVRQRMGARGVRAGSDTVHATRDEQGSSEHAMRLHRTGARPEPQRARAQRDQARQSDERANDLDYQNRIHAGPLNILDARREPLPTRSHRTVDPSPSALCQPP